VAAPEIREEARAATARLPEMESSRKEDMLGFVVFLPAADHRKLDSSSTAEPEDSGI